MGWWDRPDESGQDEQDPASDAPKKKRARMKVYAKYPLDGEIVGHAYNGMPPPPEKPDEAAATAARFTRNRGRWK